MKKQTTMTQEQWDSGTAAATLRNLPKGEYFRLKDSETAKVYKKGEYCRSERKFHAVDCLDIWGNGRLLKPATIVFVGFTY